MEFKKDSYDNYIIESPVLIKDVELTYDTFEDYIKGKDNMFTAKAELEQELENAKSTLEDLNKKLIALESNKEDLQTLITRGSTGLTLKLLDIQRQIVDVKREIEKEESSLTAFENLCTEQDHLLQHSLNNEFIKSGALHREYSDNTKLLQMEYYTLLYRAFEVAKQMQGLSDKYTDACRYTFTAPDIRNDFTSSFPYINYISEVRNNFNRYDMHKNAMSSKYIEDFISGMGEAKENTKYILFEE